MNRIELIRASGKFLYCHNDTNPNAITEYTVIRETNSDFVTDKGHFIKDYCWPIEVKDELVKILTERQALKKALDDSMKLIYQLNNKIARGEVK